MATHVCVCVFFDSPRFSLIQGESKGTPIFVGVQSPKAHFDPPTTSSRRQTCSLGAGCKSGALCGPVEVAYTVVGLVFWAPPHGPEGGARF